MSSAINKRFSWVPGDSPMKANVVCRWVYQTNFVKFWFEQNIRLMETRRLCQLHEPQEEWDRPWAVEVFSESPYIQISVKKQWGSLSNCKNLAEYTNLYTGSFLTGDSPGTQLNPSFFDVFKQLNVLHQAVSCFTWHLTETGELRLPSEPQGGRNRSLAVEEFSATYHGSWNQADSYLSLGARWPKWLEREFTDWKVRGSNQASASRLPLSRLGQPGSIPALMQPLAKSPVCDVSRQLNVLHQAASCSSCYDIRDIAIHAAWCSTFSCLETSQTGDSAGFQETLRWLTKRSEPKPGISTAPV
ncbi:hypothetical protein CSKR_109765 [Clonorchis sinensis]|uniref:Uncharacterized protein n=1 Tax=Clonorchis sinensis TaxID=79923 RepID=A0A419QDC5_CLOSI|nr:hypothetical protein CSKR_109765 [Clonorchis sinensis]